MHIGQQVEVKVPTLNRSFPGRVARFSDKVQMSTRTMDTEVDVPNPLLLLIPGMYAEVNLTLAAKNNALSVPVTAVDTRGLTVMVVTEANRHRGAESQAGSRDRRPRGDPLRSEGRDLVVIGNRGGLQPGQTVEPKIVSMGEAS